MCKNASSRKWKENNPEKNRASSRKWENNNPENKRARNRKWRENNPGKVRAKIRKWRENNPDKVRASESRRRTRKTNAGGSFTGYEWKTLCKYYDYRCLKCGEQFPPNKLTHDHVIAVSNGGTSNIDNIQPLCQRCNSRKGATNTDYRKGFDKFKCWAQPKLID
ncbi:MAG: HNH endonuclease [Ketobacter sp.]|nr:HNH endonuclease [Ketobacter sp.]